MGQMVNHQSLADQMNRLMDRLEELEPGTEEYNDIVEAINKLYSVCEGEVKLGLSCSQAKEKNQTDVQIQTLKNEAEKDKNSKLLMGTIIGAGISAAAATAIAKQCRSDEDNGKPWLSKSTGFLNKFIGK